MAPLGVTVAQLPAQTEGGEKLALITGTGVTLTSTVFWPKQPPLEPIAVKVVLEEGETLMLVPVIPPGFHVKEGAPEAESRTLLPAQIVAAGGLMVTTGSGFTVTITVAVLVQPKAFAPVTV